MSEVCPSVNVRDIMKVVRERARAESHKPELARPSANSIPYEFISAAARLKTRMKAIRVNVARIGELPPVPPTFRGRAGAILVRLIRRALFWLIPSLQAMQEQIATALEDQIKATEELMKAVQNAHLRIESMQSEHRGPGKMPE